MSDIRFRCPECRGKLAIATVMALREVPCPLCGKTITAWGADLLDIRFRCPACNDKLVVDMKAAGTEVSCPKCEQAVKVPARAEEAAVAMPLPALPKASSPHPFPSPGPSRAGTLSKDEMDFLTSGSAEPAKAHPVKD